MSAPDPKHMLWRGLDSDGEPIAVVTRGTRKVAVWWDPHDVEWSIVTRFDYAADIFGAYAAALTVERDEARTWVRRLTAKERVLTCVYCGEAYPPGSPTHGAEVLTAHVKVCTKHPMREALDIIRTLLASAHPHPVERPTMTAAWAKARAYLGDVADDADPDGRAADDAANARLGQ